MTFAGHSAYLVGVATASLTAEQALAILTETPSRLGSLTTGLTPTQLRTAPAAGEWSANEVLAHLRSCADVWGDCLRKILDEDEPTVRAVNPRAWITRTNYLDLQFRPSLRAFAQQRTDLLAVLGPLPAPAWRRSATVTGAGSPLRKSVRDYAERMAKHERAHLTQIEQIVNALR